MSREEAMPDAPAPVETKVQVGGGMWGRGMWPPGWLAWWRRPAGGNAVGHLDAHMARDIGLPRDVVSRLEAERLLSRGRDGEPWSW